MTLWIIIAVMCLSATLFVASPLYRHEQRLSMLIASSVVLIVVLSIGLYAYQGKPEIPSAIPSESAPDIEAMVASLAARMATEPDNIEGWKMLGRSYATLEDYSSAVEAYERAVELEDGQVAQTLVDLGASILARDNSRVEGRTAALFESALAIDANNPSALFYGGIAALNRNNKELAADRWEKLLSLNPPENIRAVVEQRVAEWRGQTGQSGPVVELNIELASNAFEQLPPDTSVFVIARDPKQPSPPIAVTRRQLSELPGIVTLSDAEAMIPGRNLSAFAEFEVIARVSISGEPAAQSGDWFAAQLVRPAENNKIELLIDQQIP